MKTIFFQLLFVACFLTSCTSGGGGSESSSVLDPVKEIIGDLIGTTPADVKATELEVVALQKTVSTEPGYQITPDDQDFLMSEALIDEASEIKAWVK